ncbi:hypothetical protein [Halarcobacter bivalviorum]|uniref:hypothetical protein n=1 Tax=Halarcobacter bivalviorum TaxID=663364 RepID=UPI00100ACAC3|nr:hypothetical protein [Halarcobacter bivalviorum]RXK08034.1 hypothetical protein CRU97_01425 [Halarcobacter bivalviorum]
MSDYNSYDGRIAEILVETFLKKHGYLVQSYGVEHQVGLGMDLINSTQVKNDNIKNIVTKYMSMPDFVVMKLCNNKNLEQIFFIDVKYRTFNSNNDFKEAISRNGDLYNHARKYKELWDGKTFIFLIAKIGNNVCSYYDSVNRITDHQFIRQLDTNNNSWLDIELLYEYNEKVTSLFKD